MLKQKWNLDVFLLAEDSSLSFDLMVELLRWGCSGPYTSGGFDWFGLNSDLVSFSYINMFTPDSFFCLFKVCFAFACFHGS